MTRDAFVTRLLRIIGDSSLTVEAVEWLENILYEVMAVGKWRHLQANSTQATADNDDDYSLPSDYNGYLVITSSVDPYELTQVSKEEMEVLKRKGDTGYPKYWATDGSLYIVNPKPVTGYLPTLYLAYQKIMTLPSSGTSSIETTTGLDSYWIKYLMDGCVSEGFRYIDDIRQDSARIRWEKGLELMQRYCSQSIKRGGSRVGQYSAMRGSGMPKGRNI